MPAETAPATAAEASPDLSAAKTLAALSSKDVSPKPSASERKKRIKALQRVSDNAKCVDCRARRPTWGVFIQHIPSNVQNSVRRPSDSATDDHGNRQDRPEMREQLQGHGQDIQSSSSLAKTTVAASATSSLPTSSNGTDTREHAPLHLTEQHQLSEDVNEHAVLRMGAFCCLECASAHRAVSSVDHADKHRPNSRYIHQRGAAVTQVQSLHLQKWSALDVQAMEMYGNKAINAIYEATFDRAASSLSKRQPNAPITYSSPPMTTQSQRPLEGAHQASRERFVRQKYYDLLWYSPRIHERYACQALKQYSITKSPVTAALSKNKSGKLGSGKTVSPSRRKQPSIFNFLHTSPTPSKSPAKTETRSLFNFGSASNKKRQHSSKRKGIVSRRSSKSSPAKTVPMNNLSDQAPSTASQPTEQIQGPLSNDATIFSANDGVESHRIDVPTASDGVVEDLGRIGTVGGDNRSFSIVPISPRTARKATQSTIADFDEVQFSEPSEYRKQRRRASGEQYSSGRLSSVDYTGSVSTIRQGSRGLHSSMPAGLDYRFSSSGKSASNNKNGHKNVESAAADENAGINQSNDESTKRKEIAVVGESVKSTGKSKNYRSANAVELLLSPKSFPAVQSATIHETAGQSKRHKRELLARRASSSHAVQHQKVELPKRHNSLQQIQADEPMPVSDKCEDRGTSSTARPRSGNLETQNAASQTFGERSFVTTPSALSQQQKWQHSPSKDKRRSKERSKSLEFLDLYKQRNGQQEPGTPAAQSVLTTSAASLASSSRRRKSLELLGLLPATGDDAPPTPGSRSAMTLPTKMASGGISFESILSDKRASLRRTADRPILRDSATRASRGPGVHRRSNRRSSNDDRSARQSSPGALSKASYNSVSRVSDRSDSIERASRQASAAATSAVPRRIQSTHASIEGRRSRRSDSRSRDDMRRPRGRSAGAIRDIIEKSKSLASNGRRPDQSPSLRARAYERSPSQKARKPCSIRSACSDAGVGENETKPCSERLQSQYRRPGILRDGEGSSSTRQLDDSGGRLTQPDRSRSRSTSTNRSGGRLDGYNGHHAELSTRSERRTLRTINRRGRSRSSGVKRSDQSSSLSRSPSIRQQRNSSLSHLLSKRPSSRGAYSNDDRRGRSRSSNREQSLQGTLSASASSSSTTALKKYGRSRSASHFRDRMVGDGSTLNQVRQNDLVNHAGSRSRRSVGSGNRRSKSIEGVRSPSAPAKPRRRRPPRSSSREDGSKRLDRLDRASAKSERSTDGSQKTVVASNVSASQSISGPDDITSTEEMQTAIEQPQAPTAERPTSNDNGTEDKQTDIQTMPDVKKTAATSRCETNVQTDQPTPTRAEHAVGSVPSLASVESNPFEQGNPGSLRSASARSLPRASFPSPTSSTGRNHASCSRVQDMSSTTAERRLHNSFVLHHSMSSITSIKECSEKSESESMHESFALVDKMETIEAQATTAQPSGMTTEEDGNISSKQHASKVGDEKDDTKSGDDECNNCMKDQASRGTAEASSGMGATRVAASRSVAGRALKTPDIENGKTAAQSRLSHHLETQSWHPNRDTEASREDEASKASSLDQLRKQLQSRGVLKRVPTTGAGGDLFENMRKRTSKTQREQQRKARDAFKSDLFARLDREEDAIASASGPLFRRSIPERSKSDAASAFGFEASFKPGAAGIRRSIPARSWSSTTGLGGRPWNRASQHNAGSNSSGQASVSSFTGFSKPDLSDPDGRCAGGSLRGTRTTKKMTPVIRNNHSLGMLKFNANPDSLLSPGGSTHSFGNDSFGGDDFDFE